MAVTPIRRSLRAPQQQVMPAPQQMSSPAQQDWAWDGVNWCPPFPCPPPCPPSPPGCFSAIAKADACWDQSQALEDLITKVIEDIFEKNPGIIPPPPPGAGTGPILGVTDGSAAAPGEVGEFQSLVTNINYGGTPTITNQVVSTLIVQPGDWSIWASAIFTAAVGFAEFRLVQPLAAGLSGDVRGQVGTDALLANDSSVMGSAVRGSFTVPTLLAFTVLINQSASGLSAGTLGLTVAARRMR